MMSLTSRYELAQELQKFRNLKFSPHFRFITVLRNIQCRLRNIDRSKKISCIFRTKRYAPESILFMLKPSKASFKIWYAEFPNVWGG